MSHTDSENTQNSPLENNQNGDPAVQKVMKTVSVQGPNGEIIQVDVEVELGNEGAAYALAPGEAAKHYDHSTAGDTAQEITDDQEQERDGLIATAAAVRGVSQRNLDELEASIEALKRQTPSNFLAGDLPIENGEIPGIDFANLCEFYATPDAISMRSGQDLSGLNGVSLDPTTGKETSVPVQQYGDPEQLIGGVKPAAGPSPVMKT